MATPPNPPEDPSQDFYAYYRLDPKREPPESARNTLLVVGALIAAATFQAGINPPGGVWQDQTHAGKAILGSNKAAFSSFLFFNTLAFSSSLKMITYFIMGCPFQLEVLTAIYSMSGIYISIAAVGPPGAAKSAYVVIALYLPYAVRLSLLLLKKYEERN